MEQNLELTGGLIVTERVALALGGGDAHDVVRDVVQRASESGRTFADELRADERVHLSEGELEAALDPKSYLGSAEAFVDRALALYREGTRVSDAFERGMRTRREVLGDEHVDDAIARTTGFTEDFQDLITRYAWGEIWSRDGLDRRTRSCITLTALVALGREEELAMHVRAALRIGLTPDEIKEVLLHSAIYCGVPAANGAFAVAQRVLDEHEPSA